MQPKGRKIHKPYTCQYSRKLGYLNFGLEIPFWPLANHWPVLKQPTFPW